jgi:hypothetical protein
LFVGVDLATKHDSAAVVAVVWTANGAIKLVSHRIWQPSPENPLDLENTIEWHLHELHSQGMWANGQRKPTNIATSAGRNFRKLWAVNACDMKAGATDEPQDEESHAAGLPTQAVTLLQPLAKALPIFVFLTATQNAKATKTTIKVYSTKP